MGQLSTIPGFFIIFLVSLRSLLTAGNCRVARGYPNDTTGFEVLDGCHHPPARHPGKAATP
jgi:hypothetical protein